MILTLANLLGKDDLLESQEGRAVCSRKGRRYLLQSWIKSLNYLQRVTEGVIIGAYGL